MSRCSSSMGGKFVLAPMTSTQCFNTARLTDTSPLLSRDALFEQPSPALPPVNIARTSDRAPCFKQKEMALPLNALAAIECDATALGGGEQQRTVRIWAAAHKNDAVVAAADSCFSMDNDFDADAVSTNRDKDRNIKHNRSASEGDATANACNTALAAVAVGGMTDHHSSASVGELACESRIAVAVQMYPRVAWRDGTDDWIVVAPTA
jgi:hypothetical protein